MTVAHHQRSRGGREVAEPATLTAVRAPAPSPAESGPRLIVPETPRDTTVALRGEEASRMRTFAPATAFLCLFGIFLVWPEPNRGLLHWLALADLFLFSATSAYVWLRAHRNTLTPRVLDTFHVLAAVVFVPLEVHFGVFSPIVIALVFGISFFARSEGKHLPVAMSLGSSLIYFVLALLIAFQVVEDPSKFSSIVLTVPVRVTMAIFIEAICLMTIWLARSSRRAAADAIALATAQARAIGQRDALLEEARQSLARLEREGEGRFSGLVVGGWKLANVIGRGGMGDVYAAHHVASNREGALKVLNVSSSAEPDLVRRFVREAQIAARLRGPNLVRVYDVGTAPDGGFYIAMERLVGRDLAALLRDSPRMSRRDALALLDDVARGLEVAHELGVVHRDLKPANLFFAEGQKVWKILDFGIAKLGASGTLTEAQIIGTPGYMAPEQVTGDDADRRADVFSLGAVMYRVLTGRAPFAGGGPRALHAVVFESPPRPSRLAPELGPDVERVLCIALAKTPDDRFAQATDFARALRQASDGTLDPDLRAKADALVDALPWS